MKMLAKKITVEKKKKVVRRARKTGMLVRSAEPVRYGYSDIPLPKDAAQKKTSA